MAGSGVLAGELWLLFEETGLLEMDTFRLVELAVTLTGNSTAVSADEVESGS